MSQRPPERIRTERLLLRCWRPDDAPLIQEAIAGSLEHLRPWLPWALAEPSPAAAMAERLELFAAWFQVGEDWHYGIFAPGEQRVIGGCGLHPRIGPLGIEIGYWIRADETRRGYATEAAEALTRAALALPGIERVEIRCDARNHPSAGIPRKLGYQLVETRPDNAAPGGGPREVLVFRLARTSGEPGRGAARPPISDR
jgi:RimJ/RimL family protein N-acetyltransferase